MKLKSLTDFQHISMFKDDLLPAINGTLFPPTKVAIRNYYKEIVHRHWLDDESTELFFDPLHKAIDFDLGEVDSLSSPSRTI